MKEVNKPIAIGAVPPHTISVSSILTQRVGNNESEYPLSNSHFGRRQSLLRVQERGIYG